jgi:TonB family protein
MSRWWAILALLILGSSMAAEETKLVARIIDTSNSRVPTHTVAPNYPQKARRDRIEGEVHVCFHVNREGRPHRVSVRTSTNRAFERPSLKAARASRFRPLADDDPLPQMKFCRTFVFALEPAEPGAD